MRRQVCTTFAPTFSRHVRGVLIYHSTFEWRYESPALHSEIVLAAGYCLIRMKGVR